MRVPFRVLLGLTRLPERRTLRPLVPSAASLAACSKSKHQQLRQPGCLEQLRMLLEENKHCGDTVRLAGPPVPLSREVHCRTACWPQVRLCCWQVQTEAECCRLKSGEHLSHRNICSIEAAWSGLSRSAQPWQVGQLERQAQSEQEPTTNFSSICKQCPASAATSQLEWLSMLPRQQMMGLSSHLASLQELQQLVQ